MAMKNWAKCKGVDPSTKRIRPGYKTGGKGRCPVKAKAPKRKAGEKRAPSVISRKAYEACVLDRDAAKAALAVIDQQNAEASAKKTAAQLKKALKSGQLDPGAPGAYYAEQLFPGGMSGLRGLRGSRKRRRRSRR
jgi:hypothetical protein